MAAIHSVLPSAPANHFHHREIQSTLPLPLDPELALETCWTHEWNVAFGMLALGRLT